LYKWETGFVMTIRDVAEMARVSKGTVSKVLNGAPGVGAQTRQRVLKLIEKLDFHPNATARGLAARQSNTLGFIIPHTGRYTLTSTFWPVLLIAITEEATRRGRNVLLSTTQSEGDIDSAFRSILKGRRIDGAVIGAEMFGEMQLAELLVKNMPFVMVGRSPHLATHYVEVDNKCGARMAAEHLVSLGHTSLAVLAGPPQLPYVADRVEGFLGVLRERGLREPVVVHCAYDTEETAACVTGILQGERPPTAIFLAAGDFVIGALRACQNIGRNVPKDVSLISFDDHPFFPHLTPPITAVCQPLEEMGQAAVGMLFQLIAGQEPAQKAILLPPRLALRGSCAAPRSSAGTAPEVGGKSPL
jgi:DNA-binding LacI/PurR family transcriptional regulator